MTPEIRVQVNESGFCSRHFQLMVHGNNRLGLSLMAATYLERTRERLTEDRSRLRSALLAGVRGAKRFGRRISDMRDRRSTCPICDRMDHTMRNYCYTLAVLYRDEVEFRAALEGCGGVCLHHLPLLCEVIRDAGAIRRTQKAEILAAVFDLVDRRLDTLHRQLNEFSERFDYRNREPMTEELRDSVPATIATITGPSTLTKAGDRKDG